ncbi:MAG: DNA cytosine methyltransferase, partial [Planctomycetes bacterium]|nr:DNA cytosine methyltransferase [Planctomycetota bacterium]
RFPNVPNIGDITQHDWKQYRGRCDLVIGGSPCFAGGTLVLTSEGLKPISEVQVGDQVLTHRHRYRRVLRTGSKIAPVAWITGQGNPGTVVTAEHPYWAMPMRMEYQSKKTGFKRVFGDAEWFPARVMTGKFWSMPAVHPESGIPPIVPEGNERMDWEVNEHLFWLLGAYLGDGWTRLQGNRRGQLIICDGKHHGMKIAEIAARCNLRCSVYDQRTARRFLFSSKALVKWVLRHFGHGASDKSLPAWIYGLSPVFRRSLFAGYQWADGCEEGTLIKTCSIGKKLSLSMRLLGASLGLHVSVYHHMPTRMQANIEGRTVNERPQQINSYNINSRSAFFKDGNLWMKVKRFEPLGIESHVFNLEVEGDNSYTADGFFVHNCQAYSVAGLRQSLDDPRGQLTLAFVRACNDIDPPWVVWENVPGVYSAKGGAYGCFLGSLVGSDGPLVPGSRDGKWTDSGLAVGPQRAAAFGILDAQYYGVPQRRRRVFLVAVRLSHPAFAPGKTPNPAAVLFIPPGGAWNTAPGGQKRQEAFRPAGSGAADGGGLDSGREGETTLGVAGAIAADSFTGGAGGRPDGAAGNHFIPCDPSGDFGLPRVAGTFCGHSGGYSLSLNMAGMFVPVQGKEPAEAEVTSAVTAKWAKGSGGPAGDETQNLVAVPMQIGPSGGKEVDVSPTLDTKAKDGPVRNQASAAVVQGVAYPLLEVGKRTGPGNDRAGSGSGIGEDGDPMFTLQAGAKHGVVTAECGMRDSVFGTATTPEETVVPRTANRIPHTVGSVVPLDLRNATRDQRPDGREPGGGLSAKEGDPAFTVTSAGAVQAVAFSSKDDGADEGEVSPTLRAMGHKASHANGGGQVAVATLTTRPYADNDGNESRLIVEASHDGGANPPVATTGSGEVKVTPTIRSNPGSLRPEKATDAVVVDSLAVRKLTPRECERLMGLPDDWTLIPYGKGRKLKDIKEMAAYWGVTPEVARTLAADSHRYRSIGNGMAVPVVWWIGKRIEWIMKALAASSEPMREDGA